MKNTYKYALITPAYNEDKYIAETIKSVIAQSTKPILWVIVDDDSTDKTAQIIKQYTKQYSWIKYLHRKKIPGQTYYGSNVYAIEEGLKIIETVDYEYLAILDADITLPSDYYAKILSELDKDNKLGIASGVYVVRNNNRLEKALNDRRSCPKNIMVFRQKCFRNINGFIPMKYGGEDTIACFMARMNGWKTWSFPDMVVIHNKPVGTGHSKSMLKIRFRLGIGEYFLATHPLFLLFKSFRRCFKESPFILGGVARLIGYIYAFFMGEQRQIPIELINFIRKEQLERIFHGNRIPVESRIENKSDVCISKESDR